MNRPPGLQGVATDSPVTMDACVVDRMDDGAKVSADTGAGEVAADGNSTGIAHGTATGAEAEPCKQGQRAGGVQAATEEERTRQDIAGQENAVGGRSQVSPGTLHRDGSTDCPRASLSDRHANALRAKSFLLRCQRWRHSRMGRKHSRDRMFRSRPHFVGR